MSSDAKWRMSSDANTLKYLNQLTGEANKVNWASIMKQRLKIGITSANTHSNTAQ